MDLCPHLWTSVKGLDHMKLLEFFSQNNTDDGEEQTNDVIEKDLMAFILDDNDIYKKHLLPLELKHKEGDEIDSKHYNDMVKDCCLLFYKDQDFKKDPNELFPKEMRKRVADNLFNMHKDYFRDKSKDEDSRSII